MDFTAINRLRLRTAFGDNQKFQAVTTEGDLLVELFEWTDRGTVFIHDDATVGHSVFVTDTGGLGADKTFRVVNRRHADMFLWHIDGVLYRKDSKCDCAILLDDYIGFVEFKSNAANNTEAAIKENYDKASSQLELTFNDVADRCMSAGVDLTGTTMVEAYAVFNRTVPRLSAYQKAVAARFNKATSGIPLYFSNHTEI